MDKIENSWSRNYKKTENDTANTYNMTPQEITDNINTKGSSIYEDSIIKGFLKYTNFTGFLLTRVIKELEEKIHYKGKPWKPMDFPGNQQLS